MDVTRSSAIDAACRPPATLLPAAADGNRVPGDGCNGTCFVESGYSCAGGNATSLDVCQKCGDGRRTGTEACDDGGTLDGDGCTSACAVQAGYYCFGGSNASMDACMSCPFECSCSGWHTDCSGRGLSAVPGGVSPLTTSLDLSNNALASVLATAFRNLTALTALYLNGNQISALPADIFMSQRALKLLKMDTNKLQRLPVSVFDSLGTLDTLHIEANELQTLPVGLFDKLGSNLTALHLGYVYDGFCSSEKNAFTTLPPGIFSVLSKLGILSMQCLPILTLPADTLTPLTSLGTVSWCVMFPARSPPALCRPGTCRLRARPCPPPPWPPLASAPPSFFARQNHRGGISNSAPLLLSLLLLPTAVSCAQVVLLHLLSCQPRR